MRLIQASVHALICGRSSSGDADLAADDVQRQRDRELRDPLAAAGGDEVVDQPVGERLDERLELLDRRRRGTRSRTAAAPACASARRARRGSAPAPSPSPRRAWSRERLLGDRRLSLRLLGIVRPDRLARVVRAVADAVAEPLGVEQDHPDVVVARDHVHARERVLPDRRLVPEQLVGGVRAVVDSGIEEIDVDGRRGHGVSSVAEGACPESASQATASQTCVWSKFSTGCAKLAPENRARRRRCSSRTRSV